jgi:hypothetical protein
MNRKVKLFIMVVFLMLVSVFAHSSIFVGAKTNDDIPEITVRGNTSGMDFGNNSPWGTAFYVVFNNEDISQYLNIQDEALENVKEHISFAGQKDVLQNMKNLGGNRYEFWLNQGFSFKAGDKIVLETGLGIWQYDGGTIDENHNASGGEFVSIGELKTDYTYVYTGATWEIYQGEPTDFTITADNSFVSVGAEIQLNNTFFPEGTYGTPVYTSSDEAIATVSPSGAVTGVGVGDVTITATFDNIVKTIDITVTPAKTITGIELIDTFTYYVVKDSDPETFQPNISKARLVFEDGSKSPVISLYEENYQIEALDTSAIGEVDLEVVVTIDDETYETTISVNVYDYYDQKISEVAIVDWFNYAVFIQFPNTSTNLANITDASLMPNVIDNITYTRKDGTIENLQGFYMLAENLVIFPEFIYEDGQPVLDADNYNEYYLEGDMITLAGKLPIYKWTGSMENRGGDDHAMVEGTGEIIIEGFIPVTVQYRYNGNVWGVYIEYTDIEANNDVVNIKIGENKMTGVVRVPNNATTGILSYESSDTSILEISDNGIMKGLKEGTVQVTVTIEDPEKEDSKKSVTITVNVYDYITGIKFSDKAELIKDQELDLSKLKANFIWASGKTGDRVDLANASISGLDAATLGEQTTVVSVTVDGETFTGELIVNVVNDNTLRNVLIGVGIGIFVLGGAALGFYFYKKK